MIATVKADADTLAAGAEGVWVLSGDSVARLDPATNSLGKPITIGAGSAAGIAVGAGAVWVTADQEGVLWRIGAARAPRDAHDADRGG